MRVSFDDAVCSKYGMTLTEALGLAFVKSCCIEKKNPAEYIEDMLKNEKLFVNNPGTLFRGPVYHPTPSWNEKLNQLIIDSDNALPEDDAFAETAVKMQAMFPKGKMQIDGGVVYYRGEKGRVTAKLKKWWKLYNSDRIYSFDDILSATEKYVAQKEEYGTNIKCCPYFILKEVKVENPDGSRNVEFVSDLSVMLENMDDEETQTFEGF